MGKNFRQDFLSKVAYSEELPTAAQIKRSLPSLPIEHLLMIYDNSLLKNPEFKKWIGNFSFAYGVDAGEGLKELRGLPHHLKMIDKCLGKINTKTLCMVAVGGGSVGDFVGFVASIYKRGVPVVQIPTTWLSCIDSSHGGKTALNFEGAKNQIGTFHPASLVWMSKNVLSSLGEEENLSAYGEMIKMAFLGGGKFYSSFVKEGLPSVENLWKYLPMAVKHKYKIIKQDPYEESGLREILNLGHTFGHTIEAKFQFPHGIAVGVGLRFMLNWSRKRNYIKKDLYSELMAQLGPFSSENLKRFPFHGKTKKMLFKESELEGLLYKDKKRASDSAVTFIFLSGPGKYLRKKVAVGHVVAEAKRQGWVC